MYPSINPAAVDLPPTVSISVVIVPARDSTIVAEPVPSFAEAIGTTSEGGGSYG